MVLIKLIAEPLKHVMEPPPRLLLLLLVVPPRASVAVAIPLNAGRHFRDDVDGGDDDDADDDNARGWFGLSAGL